MKGLGRCLARVRLVPEGHVKGLGRFLAGFLVPEGHVKGLGRCLARVRLVPEVHRCMRTLNS